MPIELELFGDLVCPWCWLGKRRLDQALEGLPEGQVTVKLRAFELDPSMPEAGVDPVTFFKGKFGSPERAQAIFARVTQAGLADGVKFDFSRVKAPSSRLGHRAIKVVERAHGSAAAAAVQERLVRGHFEEGEDLAQRATLRRLLAEVPGVDAAAVDEALGAGSGLDEVLADERRAAELGISGVPLFLGPGNLAVSGAQPPAVLRQFVEALLEQAR